MSALNKRGSAAPGNAGDPGCRSLHYSVAVLEMGVFFYFNSSGHQLKGVCSKNAVFLSLLTHLVGNTNPNANMWLTHMTLH